jgi:hypothetical protein
MEKQFIIGEKLLSGIVQYLAQRPFMEVAEAIPALRSLEEHIAPSAAPSPAV